METKNSRIKFVSLLTTNNCTDTVCCSVVQRRFQSSRYHASLRQNKKCNMDYFSCKKLIHFVFTGELWPRGEEHGSMYNIKYFCIRLHAVLLSKLGKWHCHNTVGVLISVHESHHLTSPLPCRSSNVSDNLLCNNKNQDHAWDVTPANRLAGNKTNVCPRTEFKG